MFIQLLSKISGPRKGYVPVLRLDYLLDCTLVPHKFVYLGFTASVPMSVVVRLDSSHADV